MTTTTPIASQDIIMTVLIKVKKKYSPEVLTMMIIMMRALWVSSWVPSCASSCFVLLFSVSHTLLPCTRKAHLLPCSFQRTSGGVIIAPTQVYVEPNVGEDLPVLGISCRLNNRQSIY